MNWPYIAGFFDGEGHIDCGVRPGNPRPVITQKLRDDNVLLHIYNFLSQEGVRSTLSKPSRRTAIQHLRIMDHRSVERFLSHILPFLVVKYSSAEHAIQFIRNKKWRNSLTPDSVYHRALEIHWDSKTPLRDSAMAVGVAYGSLKYFIKKHRLRNRTRTEAMLLRMNSVYRNEVAPNRQ